MQHSRVRQAGADREVPSPEADAVLESLPELAAVHHELLGDAAPQHAGAAGAARHVRRLPRERHLAHRYLDACMTGPTLKLLGMPAEHLLIVRPGSRIAEICTRTAPAGSVKLWLEVSIASCFLA